MKVGITFSAFDLFHAGHVKMLEESKTSFDIGLKRTINGSANVDVDAEIMVGQQQSSKKQ